MRVSVEIDGELLEALRNIEPEIRVEDPDDSTSSFARTG